MLALGRFLRHDIHIHYRAPPAVVRAATPQVKGTWQLELNLKSSCAADRLHCKGDRAKRAESRFHAQPMSANQGNAHPPTHGGRSLQCRCLAGSQRWEGAGGADLKPSESCLPSQTAR